MKKVAFAAIIMLVAVAVSFGTTTVQKQAIEVGPGPMGVTDQGM